MVSIQLYFNEKLYIQSKFIEFNSINDQNFTIISIFRECWSRTLEPEPRANLGDPRTPLNSA